MEARSILLELGASEDEVCEAGGGGGQVVGQEDAEAVAGGSC